MQVLVCCAASCGQVAQVAAVRIAAKEEAQERAACKRRKELFMEDPCMLRIVAAACWWRTCVAHATSTSPVMVLPDRCVGAWVPYCQPWHPAGTNSKPLCPASAGRVSGPNYQQWLEL